VYLMTSFFLCTEVMRLHKILLVTADDFGYDCDRNRGILECFQKCSITRASVLVNGVARNEAFALASLYNIPLGKQMVLFRTNMTTHVLCITRPERQYWNWMTQMVIFRVFTPQQRLVWRTIIKFGTTMSNLTLTGPHFLFCSRRKHQKSWNWQTLSPCRGDSLTRFQVIFTGFVHVCGLYI